MRCDDARELFSHWVDDALDAPDRGALEAHLGGCAECRLELERFRRTVALLKEVAPVRAPLGFVDRVLAAARPEPWHRRLLRRLFQPLPVKLPIEAAAVLLVAVAAVYVFQRTPELQQAARQEAPAPVPAAAPSKDVPAPPAPAVGAALESAQPESAPAAGAARESVPPGSAPLELLRQPESPKPESRALDVGGRPREDTESGRKERAADAAREKGAERSREESTSPSRPLRTETKAAEEQDSRRAAAREGPPAEPSPRPEPRRERPAQTLRDSARSAPAPAAPPAAAPAPAAKALVSPEVSGRLAVTDRAAAETALRALVARLGGREVSHRSDAEGPLVEVLLPGARYAEFTRELGRIGRWSLDREPEALPADVRVTVRLVD